MLGDIDLNSEMKEFQNALVTIRGNALRCGNSIYSINNIVLVTFESVQKENEKHPDANGIKYNFFALILFSLLLSVALFFFREASFVKKLHEITSIDIEGAVTIFCILSFMFSIGAVFAMIEVLWGRLTIDRYYFIDGLRIVFSNNINLFLISRTNTGFIKETICHLEKFISNPVYSQNNELVINFSDSSINIKEAVGSNIIGGIVQGDVTNG